VLQCVVVCCRAYYWQERNEGENVTLCCRLVQCVAVRCNAHYLQEEEDVGDTVGYTSRFEIERLQYVAKALQCVAVRPFAPDQTTWINIIYMKLT